MKKILTLSKEETRLLYNLLSEREVPNRSDSRKRFKFIEVIESCVDKLDDDLRAITGKPKEIEKQGLGLLKQETEFTFKDREVFSFGKDLFEKSFEIGSVSRDQMSGKVARSPLTGRNAKIYMQVEDAFMEVKEISEKEK